MNSGLTAGRLGVTDIQCEKCGWIGDERLYTPAAPKGTADLICPACEQVCEGSEVDWKDRAGAFEAELVEVRLRLAASDAVALEALASAKKLEAQLIDLQDEPTVLRACHAAAVANADAANKRAEVAEAEVAGWRRAVRWHTVLDWRLELRVDGAGVDRHKLGAVSQYTGGWTVEVDGVYKPGVQPDRNAACAKVCELLGIPVVLPVGGE